MVIMRKNLKVTNAHLIGALVGAGVVGIASGTLASTIVSSKSSELTEQTRLYNLKSEALTNSIEQSNNKDETIQLLQQRVKLAEEHEKELLSANASAMSTIEAYRSLKHTRDKKYTAAMFELFRYNGIIERMVLTNTQVYQITADLASVGKLDFLYAYHSRHGTFNPTISYHKSPIHQEYTTAYMLANPAPSSE
jgi:ribosomal protein S13